MPRQFGQSALAFALQEALQQSGRLVGGIPGLKRQNQESALVRALQVARENRAQEGLGLQREGLDLRQDIFQAGRADKQTALSRQNVLDERAFTQSERGAENQRVSRSALQGGKITAENISGAGLPAQTQNRLFSELFGLGAEPKPAKGPTPGAISGALNQRMGQQKRDLFAGANTFLDFSQEGAAPIASLKDLILANQSFLSEDPPNRSLQSIVDRFQNIGSTANIQATRDSLPQLRPDIFQTQGDEPPPNDGSYTTTEYAEFARKWRLGIR